MNKEQCNKWIVNIAIWLSLLLGSASGYRYAKEIDAQTLKEELQKQEIVMREGMLASYRQGYMDCKSGKEMR